MAKTSTAHSFWSILLKTIVVHSVTYFLVGLLAFTLFDYSSTFADPAYNSFMRQTDDPMVAAGPLLQPIRGVMFGIVFYLLQDVIFERKRGWLILWATLVFVGIFATFGPAPGSVEGLIYTTLPAARQLGGMLEVLTQSFLLSWVIYYWLRHPGRKWLDWFLGVLFALTLVLPAMGLLLR